MAKRLQNVSERRNTDYLLVYLFSSKGSVSPSVVRKDRVDCMNISRFLSGLIQCSVLCSCCCMLSGTHAGGTVTDFLC